MEAYDVSVIIPSCRDSEQLPTILAHLEGQEYPSARYEVMTPELTLCDTCRPVIERYAAGAPVRTRIVPTVAKGVREAIVEAAHAAEGRWLLFLDEGLLAGPHVVEAHVRAQEQFGARLLTQGSITLHPQVAPNTLTRWTFEPDLPKSLDGELLSFLDTRAWNTCVARDLFLNTMKEAGWPAGDSTPFDLAVSLAFSRAGLEGRHVHAACAYSWRAVEFKEEQKRFASEGAALAQILTDAELETMFKRHPLPSSVSERFLLTAVAMAGQRLLPGVMHRQPVVGRVLDRELHRGFSRARRFAHSMSSV